MAGFKGIFMSIYEVGGLVHGHKMTLFLFQIMVYQMSPQWDISSCGPTAQCKRYQDRVLREFRPCTCKLGKSLLPGFPIEWEEPVLHHVTSPAVLTLNYP